MIIRLYLKYFRNMFSLLLFLSFKKKLLIVLFCLFLII
ncbi:hypothetical protein M6B38_392890 [Iris pallida]|uniref:Uncharacterized protein n=1 Tax=Iris pallida TaxID=29817 RepID=A0AAX6FYE6_IRIPA|nr:hypothetical protein M6B38_392890 [Iris pallida]